MNSTNHKLLGVTLALVMLVGSASYSFADAEYLSPRKQIESGVAPEDVQCKEDRVLVLRTNGSPACVTEKTAEKTGWEIIIRAFDTSKAEPAASKVASLDLSSPAESVDDKEVIITTATVSSTQHQQDSPLSIVLKSSEPYDDEGIPYGGPQTPWIKQPSPTPLNTYESHVLKISPGGQITHMVNPNNQQLQFSSVVINSNDIDVGQWFPTYLPAGQELKVSMWERMHFEIQDGLNILYAPTSVDLDETNSIDDFADNHGIGITITKSIIPWSQELVKYNQNLPLVCCNSTADGAPYKWITINGIKALAAYRDHTTGENFSVIFIDTPKYQLTINSFRYDVDTLAQMLESIPKLSSEINLYDYLN